MSTNRCPYTGNFIDADPSPITPEIEARIRELIREEIAAAMAFFEDQSRPEVFAGKVEDAIRRRAATGSARWT